jgi:hypothetical protein
MEFVRIPKITQSCLNSGEFSDEDAAESFLEIRDLFV